MPLLDGRTILVTGVLTEGSIAFHVARIAQEQGAQVVLTSFGRQQRLTEAIARRLPVRGARGPARRHVLRGPGRPGGAVGEHADRLDGVVHSIGFAPQSVLGGDFLDGAVARRRDRAGGLGATR